MTPRRITASYAGTPYEVILQDGVHHWLADEPADLGGRDNGPSPFSLVLSGLGACTVATLVMYAGGKSWPLRGVRVTLDLALPGKGERGGRITRDIHLDGELDESQRERLLDIANRCPVHRLLTGDIQVDSRLA